ncbi:NrdH-like glutaredoxin [Microbacterium phage Gretchen]|nr:NrdH-like glutaredoxin [Microbacterium phage Gretchen]
MTLLRVHTKTLSYCAQCHMTLRVAGSKGIATEELPGIDTPERAEELAVFKSEHSLSAAPIVEAVVDGVVVERWAGFRPDRIEAYA